MATPEKKAPPLKTVFVCEPWAVCNALYQSDIFPSLPLMHRTKIVLAAGVELTKEERKCAKELGYVGFK